MADVSRGSAVRADAARNAAALIAAGRRVLRAHGPDFPFTAVATEADLGRATLYRHFPSREDLVAAIVEQNVGRLAADLAAVDVGAERHVHDVVSMIGDVLVDNVELTQLLAASKQIAEEPRQRVVGLVRDALTGATATPVNDETASLVLLMLAATAVQTPPAGRPRAVARAARLLTDGLAARP